MKNILIVALMMAASVAHAQLVVRIGHAAPLSGALAPLGEDQERGVRLALEDYTARHLVLGGKKASFELVSEDDAADPKAARQAARRLIAGGVKGVVGHLNSGATLAVARLYSQAGVPLIAPAAASQILTQQGLPYVFRIAPNHAQQGSALAKFIVTRLGRRVTLIDDRTAYGQELADEIDKAIRAGGGSVLAREYAPLPSGDSAALVSRLKTQTPDVIVYAGQDTEGTPLLRQIRQAGLTARFVTGAGGCTPEFIALAGDAASDRLFCAGAGVAPDQLADKSFRERFRQRFGVDAEATAAYAYDAASALIEGMKAAGSAEPARYLAALKRVRFKGVSGEIGFDERGDARTATVTLYQFKAGAWDAVKP